jgi:predicted RNase H-like HicB family nuclease
MKFAIAIEAGTEDTAFGVVVPDLPGCFSSGDTVEEAYDNAVEAIEAHVEVLAEEGKNIPVPTPLSVLQKDREFRGWIWGMVDVPIEKLFGPAEKINITVPALVLKQIDTFAAGSHKTRSGFLTEAALSVMRRPNAFGLGIIDSNAPRGVMPPSVEVKPHRGVQAARRVKGDAERRPRMSK